MIDMKTENLEHRISLRSFQVNKHTIFSIREYFKSLSNANLKSNCKKSHFSLITLLIEIIYFLSEKF